MKILCIMDSLGSGGAERQLVGLARILRNEGYDITLMTYYPLFFYENLVKEYQIPHVYVNDAESKWKRFFALRRAIKKVSPDLIITFSPSAAQWISLVKVSGVKFRLIVSERSFTDSITIKSYIRFNMYRLACAVVTNSKEELLNLEHKFHFLKKKLTHIPNFVDFETYYPPKNTCDLTVVRITVVARLLPVKNALIFLDALKMVKDNGMHFKVNWYGVISDSYYERQVLDKCERLGLKEFFELKGESRDTLSIYHSANLFCLPSLKEGHSNAISEAMCCGLPILCSNVSDNPRLVTEGVNGFLFDPLNAEDMAEALLRWNRLSLSIKKEFSDQSLCLARKNFSSQKFTESYKNLISRVIQ